MSTTIELKKVSKYYANENAVSMGFARVDLRLDMGEFVAITGESGSGKSTLLNVISGLDTYDEGEMFVCGEDTSTYKTEEYERYRKTYIGNIFQDFNLVNSYTVYQNVELVMLLCGKKPDECGPRIKDLLELVGLTEYTDTKASKLSGGQKQRVAIARALAKDAPIIVADEPTGNLDSESAKIVMDTLAEVSRNKLVVIVTHNYEQAEPYVTRKITMHDGRIIEDKKIPRESEPRDEIEEEFASATDDMLRSSEIKLGLRNTFNLPSKFILLFIVYLFVATAILSQYASVKNNTHQRDILGYNSYFVDTGAKRAILSKQDGTAFTESEIKTLSGLDNVDYIIQNDACIDYGVDFDFGKSTISATAIPASKLKADKLTMGRMPKADNEIVIYTQKGTMAEQTINDLGDSIIGTTGSLLNYYDNAQKLIPDTLTVVGVVIDKEVEGVNWTGFDTIYVSDSICNKVQVSAMAFLSKTELNFDGMKQKLESGAQPVKLNDNVPAGQVYIPEEMSSMYDNGNASGKPLTITITNTRYSESRSFKVGKVLTRDNIEKTLGISKDSYDSYTSAVFINSADYSALYDKGNYQISVYMEDENDAKELNSTLDGKGYDVLFIKDTLSDITGGFGFVIKLISMGALIIEFIILFYIAYAVIKLIMKSRNSYYSTLRILGANKKNTDAILRIELLVMMAIAYAVDIVLVFLVKKRFIDVAMLRLQLSYLEIYDYVILFAMLMIMSLLIARRYSRKIFTNSAMNVYREEA